MTKHLEEMRSWPGYPHVRLAVPVTAGGKRVAEQTVVMIQKEVRGGSIEVLVSTATVAYVQPQDLIPLNGSDKEV